jgi:beta-glucosidase/6-phospho-beta-glucosidase/beta-galactosidase
MTRHIGRALAKIALLSALAACKPATNTSFPKDFLFGVATAGFQNEMGCPTIPEVQTVDGGTVADCADPNSDWYQWITTPAIISDSAEAISGGGPSTGPGFYELYPQDLALAKSDMHVGGFRMSLEWSRIFPTSTVGVDGYDALKQIASAEGIAFYHSVFAELKKDGLTPLVTINHYTLPLWIHNGLACHDEVSSCSPSGWLDANTITEIAKYAGFVAKEFGGEVDLWATLNEPLAVPLSGYLDPGSQRSNPPGVFADAAGAKTVIFNEISAHAQMYDAVKANDLVDADGDGKAAEIGVVYNVAPTAPADPTNELDQEAAQNIAYLYNDLFLNAVILGKLDSGATGAADARDRPDLARMDFLGVNYYVRLVIAGESGSFFPAFSPLLTFDPTSPATNLNDLYPKGIYDTIQSLEQKYNHIPIYVTENGVQQGAGDPTASGDCVRYLSWVQKAIAEGADVRGYFWWTLTDNYEWNHGMTENFGLYSVDPTSQGKPRTLRPLGQTYARIVQARAIPSDLAKQYPIQ